jgi:excisionase family DNA binding protein
MTADNFGAFKMTTSSKITESPWFTTPEAAEYLGLHPGTLRRWRIDGSGPQVCRAGNAVRYRRNHLDEFLERSIANQ